MTFERDMLLDYVMGALTPEQEIEIAQYLSNHPEEAAWVRDMFETFADVALAQEPEELPDGAEDALLARIRGSSSATQAQDAPDEAAGSPVAATKSQTAQPQTNNSEQEDKASVLPQSADNVVTLPARPKTRPWVGFAIAAALAIFAWVGLRPAYGDYVVGRQLEQVCSEASVTCQDLTGADGGELGTLARRPNNELYLVLNDDPPEGQVYQAWEIVGDAPQSLGMWDGRVLEIEQALGEESIFGVSVEPEGGSDLPTTTPIVVVPLSG